MRKSLAFADASRPGVQLWGTERITPGGCGALPEPLDGTRGPVDRTPETLGRTPDPLDRRRGTVDGSAGPASGAPHPTRFSRAPDAW